MPALVFPVFWLEFGLSGLGVPGRRHGLGGYIGAFRFSGRVNHKVNAKFSLRNHCATRVSKAMPERYADE